MDKEVILEFTYSDAWVFVCLCKLEKKKLDFPLIIEIGDALNHAVFMPKELEAALVKLQASGLILIAENNVNITFFDKSEDLITIVKKTSKHKVIETVLEELNSKHQKAQKYWDEINPIDFITDDFLVTAIKEYQKKAPPR